MGTTPADALIRLARAYRGGPPDAPLRAATGAFLGAAAADPALLRAACAALDELGPHPAAWVAITLGSAVERGADPALAGPTVWEVFARWLERLDGAAPPASAGAEDDRAQRLAALPMFAQSVVAHLARLPALRARLGAEQTWSERLAALEDESYAASWVREAIERRSGRLVVLHPTSCTGAELTFQHVANCFHLFSLVQLAVGARLPGGREPGRGVAAALRGESDERVHDSAWWHFGDPRSPTPQIGSSVWGEGHVASIPEIDGAHVLLLWPPLLGSRSWDSGFFGPALDAMPSTVTFERALAPDEARAWFARLGIASPAGSEAT